MLILQYTQRLALSPDELENVIAAYQKARTELGFGEDDNPLTRGIAEEVIKVFESGEQNLDAVVQRVVKKFSGSPWSDDE